jgi:hypothetical protein
MLVVPNMKVLTIWGKLSSPSALGHYIPIFTDFEGDKSIHGWHFWCQISSHSDHQRFVVLVVLSGGELTSLFMLSHLQICKDKYSSTPAVGTWCIQPNTTPAESTHMNWWFVYVASCIMGEKRCHHWRMWRWWEAAA